MLTVRRIFASSQTCSYSFFTFEEDLKSRPMSEALFMLFTLPHARSSSGWGIMGVLNWQMTLPTPGHLGMF